MDALEYELMEFTWCRLPAIEASTDSIEKEKTVDDVAAAMRELIGQGRGVYVTIQDAQVWPWMGVDERCHRMFYVEEP